MEDQIITTEEFKEVEAMDGKSGLGFVIVGGVLITAAAGVLLYRGIKKFIQKKTNKSADTYYEVEAKDEIPETDKI